MIDGQMVVAGSARGAALITTVPLSFWGGVDAETGEIIDRTHPLSGRLLAGRVLVLPHGRGSCSGSGVILESVRNGTAPSAILMTRLDPIIALGAILSDELDGTTIPVVVIPTAASNEIQDDDEVVVTPDGQVTVTRATPDIDQP